VEVRRRSGTVFAEVGLPDAETLQIKTGLVIKIRKAIRQQRLTKQAAATRMGLGQTGSGSQATH
jgi:predicted XRE-type DNA-binding protein